MRKTDENGRDHFKMHAPEGEKMAKSILRRLKFDNDTISKVSRLIKYHDDRPMPEMRSVRRAVNRIGEDLFPMYLEVQEADMLAQSEYRREEKSARLKGVAECYHKVVEEKQCVSVKDTCRDRKRFDPPGYKPGPELGEVLKEMHDMCSKNLPIIQREVNGFDKRKTLEVYGPYICISRFRKERYGNILMDHTFVYRIFNRLRNGSYLRYNLTAKSIHKNCKLA